MPSKKHCASGHKANPVRAADIDVFHARMVDGARFTGKYDLPAIAPSLLWPQDVISFPEAMASSCAEYDKTVHFFCDDFRFECLWRSPGKYIEKLKKFNGIIGPDFSTCPNFPLAEIIHNTYRNAACTYWFQKMGVNAIPNVRCETDTADWALSYIPKGGVIALKKVAGLEQSNPSLFAQFILYDYRKALSSATKGDVRYNRLIKSGNWTFKLSKKETDRLPVVVHAMFTGLK